MYRIKASIQCDVKTIGFSEDRSHPNGLPFQGTLLVLDQPSDMAPHGSKGHLIMVTKAAAERRLQTLIGMPLNYAQELNAHNSENAVGVITAAWIDYPDVKVKGLIWKKTFPEAESDLRRKKLGMSMELADVAVADPDADVWRLEDFYFTGATALWPRSAAYHLTRLAAAAASLLGNGGETMPEMKKKQKAAPNQSQLLIKAMSDSMAATLTAAMRPMIAALGKVVTGVEELKGTVAGMKAAGAPKTEADQILADLEALNAGAEVDAEAEEEVEASVDDSDDDDEEVEASADDKKKKKADAEDAADDGDDEDMEAESDAETVAAAAATSPVLIKAMKAATKTITTMKAQMATMSSKLAKETKARVATEAKYEAMEAQLEAAAEMQGRRTISPELLNLLQKSGVDIQASGTKKLSIAFVDKLFDNCGVSIPTETRMSFKNQLVQAKVMDDGLQNVM